MFVLRVKLVKAVDLAASDWGLFGFGGKSDPYFTFRIGSTVQKSSVVNSNLNPEWNPPEVFQFDILHPKETCLEIHVYDYDALTQDDEIGTLNIAIAPFMEREGSELLSYPITVPDQYVKQKRKSLAFLEIQLISSEKVDQTLELWENERFHIIKKWGHGNLLSNERKRWSRVEDSNISSSQFKEVAPKAPDHLNESGWNLDVSQGDRNGWVYAPAWTGPWQKSEYTLAVVRRRKWVNKCIYAESD